MVSTDDPATATEPFLYRTLCRWADCDPAGIAYFPRFFEWMDTSTHQLAREGGFLAEHMLAPRLRGFPLVKAECEFLQPANLEDPIEVRVWCTNIGRTSVALRHDIVRASDGTLLARGSEKRVHVERREGRLTPLPIDDALRAALERRMDRSGAGG